MKKIIALILSVIMIFSVAVVPGFAAETGADADVATGEYEKVFADADNALIVFVTGIGQTATYLFDESYTAEGAFENGTLQDYENYADLIANDKYQTKWNLFNAFDEAFSNSETIAAILNVVIDLLVSAFTRVCGIQQDDVNTIIRNLFKFNIPGEDGQLDPRVVTPRYAIPVSEYPWNEADTRSEARDRFYASIPCADIALENLGENYEDYLYVFNYSAFSYTSDNVSGLKEFIDTIIAENKVGATEVVLVPMSMGASVVSAYMSAYPTREENHIRRVVGIVGAWDGTEIIADLLTQTYCEPQSADLFYNGLIGDLIGEPWGYVVNIVLRLFPKQVLRDFIDMALKGLSTELFAPSPSLMNMVPVDRYEEIRGLISSEAVLAEVDAFYAAKANLINTMTSLKNEGVGFAFIAGYGLPFGACTADYSLFGFMNTAPTTNSDEIINIDSTALGTQFVAYNEVFADTEGRELSPDGSLDISGTFCKESTWFFYEQKHELEHNNTALSLVINIALGNIETVDDCDEATDAYYYPQFNGARNLRPLKNYKSDLEKHCAATGYVLTAEQKAVLAKADAMAACTLNNPEADDAVMDEVRAMLVEIGVYAPAAEPEFIDTALNFGLKGLNDIVYMVFGSKGFFDYYYDNIAGKY